LLKLDENYDFKESVDTLNLPNIQIPPELMNKDSKIYQDFLFNYRKFAAPTAKQLPISTKNDKYKIMMLDNHILPALAIIFGGYDNLIKIFHKTKLWNEMIKNNKEKNRFNIIKAVQKVSQTSLLK